jgi:hypothetical protein
LGAKVLARQEFRLVFLIKGGGQRARDQNPKAFNMKNYLQHFNEAGAFKALPNPSLYPSFKLSGQSNLRVAIFCLALVCGLATAAANQAPEPKAEDKAQAGDQLVPAADKEAASAFVREHCRDLLFIRNKEGGAGSGFIGNMRGRKVVISNTHVLAALKFPSELLDRSPLRVGTASVALGHDLMAFVVVSGGTADGIPLAESVETEAQIGDKVVVLGNAAGSGVVTPIHGELVGIGPDRIEVSAPFELGNSGSPIVDLCNGKVIGVATYAELDTLLSGTNAVRRFGYRIDSAKNWQLIDWNRFYSESDTAMKLRMATFELHDILSDFTGVTRNNFSRAYETPCIRTALEAYYAAKQDRTDSNGATRMLLASLRDACTSDLSAAKGRFTYDYFRRQLAANELIRGKFVEIIDKVLPP